MYNREGDRVIYLENDIYIERYIIYRERYREI